jgi:hypothetical protein
MSSSSDLASRIATYREKGETWKSIAAKEGVSEKQLRRMRRQVSGEADHFKKIFAADTNSNIVNQQKHKQQMKDLPSLNSLEVFLNQAVIQSHPWSPPQKQQLPSLDSLHEAFMKQKQASSEDEEEEEDLIPTEQELEDFKKLQLVEKVLSHSVETPDFCKDDVPSELQEAADLGLLKEMQQRTVTVEEAREYIRLQKAKQAVSASSGCSSDDNKRVELMAFVFPVSKNCAMGQLSFVALETVIRNLEITQKHLQAILQQGNPPLHPQPEQSYDDSNYPSYMTWHDYAKHLSLADVTARLDAVSWLIHVAQEMIVKRFPTLADQECDEPSEEEKAMSFESLCMTLGTNRAPGTLEYSFLQWYGLGPQTKVKAMDYPQVSHMFREMLEFWRDLGDLQDEWKADRPKQLAAAAAAKPDRHFETFDRAADWHAFRKCISPDAVNLRYQFLYVFMTQLIEPLHIHFHMKRLGELDEQQEFEARFVQQKEKTKEEKFQEYEEKLKAWEAKEAWVKQKEEEASIDEIVKKVNRINLQPMTEAEKVWKADRILGPVIDKLRKGEQLFYEDQNVYKHPAWAFEYPGFCDGKVKSVNLDKAVPKPVQPEGYKPGWNKKAAAAAATNKRASA